jgi:cytochrome c oxidase accessory protein FixG
LAEAAALDLGSWEWFWSGFYGFATYGNAGYMREQVCKYMCPYARFQSAMFDRDTLIISYDPERGEPRGSRSRGVNAASVGQGDCINCTLCVQVCPTGIDIRDGLQYECIGCAACIDVCNGVMDKMGSPRGLIRYATQNGMQGHWSATRMWRRVFRPRVLVYTGVLGLIAAAFVATLIWRTPFKADVVRDRGVLARLVEDGQVENVYRIQLMNSTEHEQHFRIEIEGLTGARIASRHDFEVHATEARWVPLSVQLPPEEAARLGPGAHPMRFHIVLRDHDQTVGELHEKSTFVVPR